MYIFHDSLEIRPLQPGPEALSAVLRVYQQCEDFLALGPVPTASMEMVQADLRISEEEGGVFCGVYDRTSGEMVGIVDYVPSGWQGDPQAGFLSLLMIAGPHRSRGVGACVVRAVEEALRQQWQARTIHSAVQVNNPAGIRFWQRMGYRIVSGPELQPDQTITYRLLKEV